MKIELTPQEVDAVLQCIASHPYNQVAGLINKISEQAQKQVADENADKLLKKAK